VTFNQYGREFPAGGMNDAGLVVEIMWLESSEYERPDARPTLNELQWIQYQLDRFATVDEVEAHAAELRVSRVNGKVHYLACDRGGHCAAFGIRPAAVTLGARVDEPYAESVAWAAKQGRPPTGVRVRSARRACAAMPPSGDPVTAASGVDGVLVPASGTSSTIRSTCASASAPVGAVPLDPRPHGSTPHALSRSSC
jgi:hypothetical protein